MFLFVALCICMYCIMGCVTCIIVDMFLLTLNDSEVAGVFLFWPIAMTMFIVCKFIQAITCLIELFVRFFIEK